MHCPNCGRILAPIPLGINGEVNKSFRCYNCGGFWIDGWLANRINSKALDKWPQKLEHNKAFGGTDTCPLHKEVRLERYEGESVPENLKVFTCPVCHWWWFPENTLFEYKPAQEAKVNYYKSWGMPADLKGLMLPLMALLVLIGGGVVTLRLVKEQQYALLQASGVIKNF
jgi:hypothetical protein